MPEATPARLEREADPGIVFARDLEAAFGAAGDKVGRTDVALTLAGRTLRISFAGEAVREALLPPLAHLATPSGGANDLSISVFDTASTGVEAPILPWRPPPPEPGTSPVSRYETEECCVLAAAGTGGVTTVDFARRSAVFHLDDLAALSANERAAPLREALHLLLAPHDRWLTHGGAVGEGGRGALLVGRSGSGKSTLSLACARAGMEIAADDYVVLDPGPPPIANALQSTAKLTRESAALLGVGEDQVAAAEYVEAIESAPKAEVPIERIAPGRFRGSLEVAALIAPRVAGLAAPRIQPISRAAGLQALAPSTLMQMHSRAASSLPALAELTRAVPSYSLELSTDIAANVDAVSRVVSGNV